MHYIKGLAGAVALALSTVAAIAVAQPADRPVFSIADSAEDIQRKIAAGADVNANIQGKTPLIWAALDGNAEAVRILLDHGANAESGEESDGDTALIRAAAGDLSHEPPGHSFVEVIRLLLDHGANINGRNAQGETALMRAVTNGTPDLVALLLDRGADVNAKDDMGETALMSAALFNKIEDARLLLDHGADPAIPDKGGTTAFDFAQRGNAQMAALLRSGGSKPASSSTATAATDEDDDLGWLGGDDNGSGDNQTTYSLTPPSASRWEYVGITENDQDKFYVDPESIGGNAETKYATYKQEKPSGEVAVLRAKISCDRWTDELLAINDYNPDGSLKESNTFRLEENKIVPGSAFEGIAKQVCR